MHSDAKDNAEKRMAVILFIDLMDSSELSNVLSFEEYDGLVAGFQEVATDVLCSHVLKDAVFALDSGHKHKHKYEASVRGDEMCVILYSEAAPGKEDEEKKHDIRTALRLAIEMKRKWLCSDVNAERIKDGKNIVDVGIGMNCGYVMVGKHKRVCGAEIQSMTTAEGYAINLAKRIEGYSRSGMYSRIFVSRSVYSILRIDFQIAFAQAQMAAFKGIAQPVPVYEIKSFGHVEDTAFAPSLKDPEVSIYQHAVEHNPHELWLILDLAHHYFDSEDYGKAAETYNLALEVDPEFAPAHMYLGRSYYRDFQDAQALPHLERAREKNPDSARANNFLGVCLRRLAYRSRHGSDPGELSTEKWKDLYRKAIEYHKVAMRIAEQDPKRYIWAFNAYAMTYALAIHENALWDHVPTHGEKDQALIEAEKQIDSVLGTHPVRHQNLFHHVKGFVLATHGRLDEANREFVRAIDFLRKDLKVSPKKYREKIAEIYFHRGLYGLRTEYCQKAICEAYIGDLLKNSAVKPGLRPEQRDDRRAFLEGQYWYEEARTAVENNGIKIEAMLTRCEACIARPRECRDGAFGCVNNQELSKVNRKGANQKVRRSAKPKRVGRG